MHHRNHCTLLRGALFAALLISASGIARAGTLYLARMTGQNENPPNTSTFTGTGVLILNNMENEAIVTATHNITVPVIGGHIHRGTAAINGPIILHFPAPSSPVGPITWAIPAAEVDNLKNLGHYMNFHTAANPGGVIRGTLVRALLAPSAATPVQLRLANVLDISAGASADLDQVLIQANLADAATQTRTLAQLSGGTLHAETRQQLEAMSAFGSVVLAYADSTRGMSAVGGRFNGFLRVGHESGTRDASWNQLESTVSRPYALLGVERQIGPSTRAGLALGLASGKDKFQGGAGRTEAETTGLNAFVSFDLGDSGITLDAIGGYGSTSIDTTRNLSTLARTATGSTNGRAWNVAFRASRPFRSGGTLKFVPYLLADFQEATVDGYTETGAGSAGLTVLDRDMANAATELGASVLFPLTSSVSARIQAGWRHLLDDGESSTTTWLNGAPLGFTTRFDGLKQNSARVEAAVDATLQNGAILSLGYRGLLGGDSQQLHTVEAGLTLKF